MFRRYTTKYYYTFQEVMNNANPYQAEGDNINWYGMLKNSLPNAPLYKETGTPPVESLKDYIAEVLENTFSRFRKHYIYWSDKDTLDEDDYFEIVLKIANILINTYDKYAPLMKYYSEKRDSLMAMIQSETNGAIRYNDTPQNGGDFSNDAHTTNYTGSRTVNKTEGDTPINRLVEIKNKLSSILFEWSNEFDRIMLEEGNI